MLRGGQLYSHAHSSFVSRILDFFRFFRQKVVKFQFIPFKLVESFSGYIFFFWGFVRSPSTHYYRLYSLCSSRQHTAKSFPCHCWPIWYLSGSRRGRGSSWGFLCFGKPFSVTELTYFGMCVSVMQVFLHTFHQSGLVCSQFKHLNGNWASAQVCVRVWVCIYPHSSWSKWVAHVHIKQTRCFTLVFHEPCCMPCGWRIHYISPASTASCEMLNFCRQVFNIKSRSGSDFFYFYFFTPVFWFPRSLVLLPELGCSAEHSWTLKGNRERERDRERERKRERQIQRDRERKRKR